MLFCSASLKTYAHDDVSVGSWMMGLQATYIDDSRLCCIYSKQGKQASVLFWQQIFSLYYVRSFSIWWCHFPVDCLPGFMFRDPMIKQSILPVHYYYFRKVHFMICRSSPTNRQGEKHNNVIDWTSNTFTENSSNNGRIMETWNGWSITQYHNFRSREKRSDEFINWHLVCAVGFTSVLLIWSFEMAHT